MKLKIKAKAILGAAAVMMGIFAPMFSANANPLHDAIKEGKTYEEIISLAKAHPEWVDEKDAGGDNASSLVRKSIKYYWGELESALSEIDYRFKCPFHDAVKRGNIDEIKRLLKKNPSLISTPDFHGFLPIHCVKNVATLEFLYRHGADLNALSQDGFHSTVIDNCRFYPSLVKFLLEHGVDINARNAYGCTVLHGLFEDLACDCDESASYLESIKLIMENGGEKIINALDGEGQTPLDILYSYMLTAENFAVSSIEKNGFQSRNTDLEEFGRLKQLIRRFEVDYGAQLHNHKINGCAI